MRWLFWLIFKFSSELNGGLSFFFRRLILIIIWWWSSNIILMTSKQTFSLNFFFSSEFRLSLQENLSFWFSFCSATFRVVGFEVHTKRWESYCMEIKINEHNQAVMSGALPCLGSLGPAQSLLASLATWLWEPIMWCN